MLPDYSTRGNPRQLCRLHLKPERSDPIQVRFQDCKLQLAIQSDMLTGGAGILTP
jgi:hypothetical protein